MNADDWAVVTRAPIFRALGEELTRSLLSHRPPRHYARGEQIFQQGDEANAFFLVIDGWVKVFREHRDGEHVIVEIFAAGETFAEAAMFLGGRYPVSAEAVAPARLARVDGHALRNAMLANPQIALDVLAAASVHLKQLVAQIEQLKVQSAPERVAHFLLAQVPNRRGPVQIALPYEKALIASRLGMKPESFSRALARLRDFGVVVDRDSVSIADVARVVAYLEHPEDDDEAGLVPRRTRLRAPSF